VLLNQEIERIQITPLTTAYDFGFGIGFLGRRLTQSCILTEDLTQFSVRSSLVAILFSLIPGGKTVFSRAGIVSKEDRQKAKQTGRYYSEL